MAYTREDFELDLQAICEILTEEARTSGFNNSTHFESRVRELAVELCPDELSINPNDIPQIFPDIPAGRYGIEVKYTEANTWRCIANSIFEGHRASGVEFVDIVYGKMGGVPEVRWGRYEDCVCHVRTSHVPRFEVDLEAKQSLFELMGVTYEEFSGMSDEDKMPYVRGYARSRLKEGEHLWWLESLDSDDVKTLPLAARLYTMLPNEEKRQLRAEAALLCPEIVGSGRNRTKYNNVPLFLLTYHGVAAHQARDLFSAGSASHDGTCDDTSLNGNYVACALYDIQGEIKAAASYLPDELFVEYWGEGCPPKERLRKWLAKLDYYAAENTVTPWKPSDHLKFDGPPVYPPDYLKQRRDYSVVDY